MDIQTPDPIVDSSSLNSEPVEGADDSGSLSDHEAQFSPNAPRASNTPIADLEEIPKTPANTGQFAPKAADGKHKAASQRATPEDVAEINRLTKELRETEARLADKDPDAAASPRIRTLKRQIAALKALETPAPVETPKPAPKPAPVAQTASEFTDPKPKIEDFNSEDDPLDAYMLALARWDRKRERFEESQQQQQASTHAAQEEARHNAVSRMQTFAQVKPDFWQVTEAFASRQLPAVLFQALVRSDKNAEFVYHLAQHSDLADQLIFETDGKPLSDAHVAFVQRRLEKELSQGQAASTGSAAPAKPFTPPRPPNPVRTGPIRTGDELPGDESSLADHEKAFHRRR